MPAHVGFVVDKVAVVNVSLSEYFNSCQSVQIWVA